MKKRSNSDLTSNAQSLRKNMTPEERHLWYDFLCHLDVPFKRQRVIEHYIVDFYCASAKLVIELDGSQHFTERGKNHDIVRDNFLAKYGLKVLRYSNRMVSNNFDDVCSDILNHITNNKPPCTFTSEATE